VPVEVVDSESDVVVSRCELHKSRRRGCRSAPAWFLARHAHEDIDCLVTDRHPRYSSKPSFELEGDRAVDIAMR